MRKTFDAAFAALLITIGALAAPVHVAPAGATVVPASQKLFMVSDSVGLGVKSVLPGYFPGWQLTITGKPGIFTEQLESGYVAPLPPSSFGDNAVVAAGYNYPYWDPARFDRAVDHMVNTLLAKGVKHIYWVTFREVKPQYFSGWSKLTTAYRTLYLAYPKANGQLRAALGRHPELTLIDWAAVSDQTGLTYDAIHLNPTGAARYSNLVSATVRNSLTRKPAGTVSEITAAGANGVPADAAAVSLNLTVVYPRTAGFLTVYPCGGDVPNVSNLNFRPSETVASAAVVPIGVDGKICVYQSADAHVLVDLNGAFGATSGFLPIAPQRADDTRKTGGPPPGLTVHRVHLAPLIGAPTGAFEALVNLTTLAGAGPVDVWLYTCGDFVPPQPTRTVEAGVIRNLVQLVPTDAAGDVCVITTGGANILVDLFGAFPTTADIHSILPQRVVDTLAVGVALVGGTSMQIHLPGLASLPADTTPAGVIITLTAVLPQGIGFGSVTQCDHGPLSTSTINVVPNHTATNSAISAPDGAGDVCVWVSVTSHVQVDLSGWFGTSLLPLPLARLLDTRY